MANKRETERDGFFPGQEQGHMFDKQYYGLHVPSTEDFDYENSVRLRKEGRLPAKPGSPNMFRDGFIRIDERKIKAADQSQYNDNGQPKRTVQSKTFSGYARKRGRK